MTNCTKLDQACRTPDDCAMFDCKEWNEWQKCAVPACKNKSCKALNSRYCWPHTPGDALTARKNLLETWHSELYAYKTRNHFRQTSLT